MKPVVFVSCGQYAENEKQLGKDICTLLAELRPDVNPYFAENQSTAEGLSSHILKALHQAAGFICVMHKRGNITTPDGKSITRGSVWIEQEIAITAFMNHVLDRNVPILFYKQVGIGHEGIRQVLLMNPRVEFSDEAQVIDNLRVVLPTFAFVPFQNYDLEPKLTFRKNPARSTSAHHEYTLIADVENIGSQQITDFKLQVFFPRPFLKSPALIGIEDIGKSTSTHRCFSVNQYSTSTTVLYPGDRLNHRFEIEYMMNDALEDDRNAMQSEIILELSSGSMKPKRRTFAIKEYLDW